MVNIRSYCTLSWMNGALLPAVVVGASCLLAASLTQAQPGKAGVRSYGKGQPQAVSELPPGQLRNALESLPPTAKARALRHLQGFSFPGNDVAHLHADPKGDIFYADPIVEGIEPVPAEPLPAGAATLSEAEVFSLHSKPGASRTVYLDMDGHVVTGTRWNTTYPTLYMQAFSADSDPSTFTADELARIAETWKRVAEDLAPFDIDVTTEEPAAFGPSVGHILVSPVLDAYGNPIYSDGYGGVAYVGVWGNSNFAYYQPALVFPENLGNSAKNIAEAASHELGHNLGLSHDGTSTQGYYAGHGSGATDWAPIMGVGYYAQITQWSKGEYPDANNSQDDLAIIGARLTYSGDDHEDLDALQATPLVRTAETLIESTTPASDPFNLYPDNKGVIEDETDVDLFYVDVAAGTIELQVTPVWRDAFANASQRSANIDLLVTLMDEYGNYVAHANPTAETNAVITASVGAGRYILAVEGTGFGNPPADGYPAYGSIGQYSIHGTVPGNNLNMVPPTAPGDVTASIAGDNAISLAWTDQGTSIEDNEAGYRLFRQRNSEPEQIIATLPANSSSYTDNNLASGSYVYFVEVYNSAGNDFSNMTAPITVEVPSTAVAASEQTLMGEITAGTFLNTTVEAGFEQLSELHQGGKPANRVSRLEHVWTIDAVAPGAQAELRVKAQAPVNSDNDDFLFSYSLDNGQSYSVLGTVENGSGLFQLSSFLPQPIAGNVLVKVTDTDATRGNSSADSITVYSLAIISSGEPGDTPPQVDITSAPADASEHFLGASLEYAAAALDDRDGDVSSAITWTSDKDGPLGSGPSLTVVLKAVGTHMITASAVDSANLRGEESISVIIIDPDAPPAPINMSVTGLDNESVILRNKWNAIARVTVKDNDDGMVDGATVTGTWSGGATGAASCVTVAGTCTVSKNGLRSSSGSVTFTITGMSHPDLEDSGGGLRTVVLNAM